MILMPYWYSKLSLLVICFFISFFPNFFFFKVVTNGQYALKATSCKACTVPARKTGYLTLNLESAASQIAYRTNMGSVQIKPLLHRLIIKASVAVMMDTIWLDFTRDHATDFIAQKRLNVARCIKVSLLRSISIGLYRNNSFYTQQEKMYYFPKNTESRRYYTRKDELTYVGIYSLFWHMCYIQVFNSGKVELSDFSNRKSVL